MKKIIAIIIISVYMFAVLIGPSFAMWSQNSEVKFKLTISQPSGGGCCDNPVYSTVQEGIDILKNVKYNCINNKMQAFKDRLEARIEEINNLPFGGITREELSEECHTYRNVDIKRFGNCINKYAEWIRQLQAFHNDYINSMPWSVEREELRLYYQMQITALWDLHSNLWITRSELYIIVTRLELAGEAKIDYNKHKK